MQLRAELVRKVVQAVSASCHDHSFTCGRHGMARLTKSGLCAAATQAPEYAFEMVCSTIRYGPGVTQEIGHDMHSFGARNIMVLTDANVAKLSPMKAVLDSLTKAKIRFEVFDRVRVEPTDQSMQEAIAFARRGDYDAFVAVGGGSTMDTAKAADLFASNSDASFLDYVVKPFGRQLMPKRPMRPLVCVPTTAGTGSETTTVSIFSLHESGVKSGIRNRALKPHLALVDPMHMRSMPKHVAVYSGFDVLCHALESYTTKEYFERYPRPTSPAERPVYQGANPISDVWSREALRIIRQYFRRAVADPDDEKARSQMLLASSFAGMGFGNAGVHLCHGLSYPISGQVKDYKSSDYPADHALIPHGLSVVLTAPADFIFSAPACPERHLEAARLLGYEGNARADDAGLVLADIVRGFMRDFNVPNGLKAVGFGKEDVGGLVQSAMNSLSSLQLCPREPTQDALTALYEDSMNVY